MCMYISICTYIYRVCVCVSRVGPWLRVPGSGICATAGIRSECSFESLRDFVETLDKPDTIIPNLTTEA